MAIALSKQPDPSGDTHVDTSDAAMEEDSVVNGEAVP